MDDPEEEAKRLIRPLIPFYEELIGREQTSVLFNQIASDVPGLVNSPRTWQCRIEDLVEAGLAESDSGDLESRMQSHLPTLLEAYFRLSLDSRQENLKAMALQPCVEEFLVFSLRVANEGANRKLVLAATPSVEFATLLSQYPGIGRLLVKGEGIPPEHFEEWAGIVAGNVAHIAETFYRPMLASALKITRIGRGESIADPDDLLGVVMGRCRDLWQTDQPELLDLLIDRVRIVRNSEAHRRTQIDPRSQTVTFVNRRGNQKEEALGPLNSMEFSRFFQEFWQLCLALHATFQLLESSLGAAGDL